MKLAIATSKYRSGRRRADAGFTLAEVLAALLFLAIVIPAAVEVLHVASLAGEVAARKSEAARVADRVLSESIVTTNWMARQSGTISEGILDFRWIVTSRSWTQLSPAQSSMPMQLVTARSHLFGAGQRLFGETEHAGQSGDVGRGNGFAIVERN